MWDESESGRTRGEQSEMRARQSPARREVGSGPVELAPWASKDTASRCETRPSERSGQTRVSPPRECKSEAK